MAARNRTSFSGSDRRPNHHRIEESASRHPRRILTLAEVRILEDRIAAQGGEIEAVLLDNRRLAATHVALKRDTAAAQHEIRRLSDIASSANAETDAQVREVHERSHKLEAEARSIDIDGLSTDLERVRAEIKQHRDERTELTSKLNDIESDILKSQPELQEFSDLKAEIETWQKEIRRGRAAIEYERKMCSDNFELTEAMEKHKNTIAGEAEKLRSELANAEQRAMAAVVDPAISANQGPGYAIHQPGYGGNSLSNPHAIHQVAVPIANQGPGYAIHQPGYGGNSLSDPHIAHQTTLSVANQGPGYAIHQPGYVGNPIADPHVNQVMLPLANQDPGYAIHQPGYGGNPLSNPHAVHQATSPVANQDPGFATHQPGYGGNSLSNPHAVHQATSPVVNQDPGYAIHQPGYGGNSLSNPHAVHQATSPVANQGIGYAINQPEYDRNPLPGSHVVLQGKSPDKNGKQRPNKKGKDKLGNNEAQLKKIKCLKCKKRHFGVCLFGKKVCFRCKKPGHISRDCALNTKEKIEKEGKVEGFAAS